MEISPRRSRAPSVLALAAALAVSGPFAVSAAPARAAATVVAAAADPPVSAARVLGRHVEAGYETLVVSVDVGGCADPWNQSWQVRLDGAPGEALPWSGVATQARGDVATPPARSTLTLVVRRVAAPADSPPKAPALLHLYAPARCGSSPAGATGQHLRFALPETSGLPDDPQAFATYLVELGQKLRFGSPFGAFAQAHLHALAEERFRASAPSPPPRPSRQTLRKLGVVGFGHRDVGTAPARPAPAGPRRAPGDLARLMSTTADATSLQQMLQQDRRLAAYTAGETAAIPIDKLAGPTFFARPWQDLFTGLATPVPVEPLADATPADFYFVRFAGLPHLYRLLDGVDGWLARAAAVAGAAVAGAGFASPPLDGAIDRAVVARYLTELGLPLGPRAAAVAAAVSGEVAVVGSDPYLREGSDVTLLWRARGDGRRGPAAPTGRDAGGALAAALDEVAAGHGALTAGDSEAGGVVVHAVHSADGAIRRFRASAGGFELLSNSAGAVRRVLAAIGGHAPRLGDQRAFRYLLARDAATPADVLLFAGDPFVARIAGAPLAILEARRQLALGELETPGLAALLFGWMYGRAPASADELVASGLLSRDELAHASGETLAWTPGAAARSSWGTPAALTPLIDLPAPALVTATERDAYRLFVDDYERAWGANVGPLAVRLSWRGGANGPVDVDVRLAPFSRDDGGAYAALAHMVGDARLASGRSAAGARAAVGIGAMTEPRRWIRQLLAPSRAGRSSSIDWLGDWAMVGVDDSPAPPPSGVARSGYAGPFDLADLLRSPPESTGQPLDLPVYAGVAVRDEAAADLFLRAARTGAALGETPIDWRPRAPHRGIAITRVERMSPGAAGARMPPFRPIYYAVCRSTLALALGEETLRRRIDDCLDGRLPRLEAKPKVKRAAAENARSTGAEAAPGAQLVVDVDLPPGGRVWSLAGGLLDRLAAADDGASVAETIFRGAPGLDAAGARALATAYLGGAPVTPEGAAYLWSDAGVVDPLRGTAHAPRALAAAAATRDRRVDQPHLDPGLRAWLDALAHARLEIAIDSEPALPAGPAMQSAHLHLTARRAAR